jgi:hypothetical protein
MYVVHTMILGHDITFPWPYEVSASRSDDRPSIGDATMAMANIIPSHTANRSRPPSVFSEHYRAREIHSQTRQNSDGVSANNPLGPASRMALHPTNTSRKGKEKETPLPSDWFSPIMMGPKPLHTTLNSTQPCSPYPQMPTMRRQPIATMLTSIAPNHEDLSHFEILNQTRNFSHPSNVIRQGQEPLIDLGPPSSFPISSVDQEPIPEQGSRLPSRTPSIHQGTPDRAPHEPTPTNLGYNPSIRNEPVPDNEPSPSAPTSSAHSNPPMDIDDGLDYGNHGGEHGSAAPPLDPDFIPPHAINTGLDMDLDGSGYDGSAKYSHYNLQVRSRPLVSGRLRDVHAKRVASSAGGQHLLESPELLAEVRNLAGESDEGGTYNDPPQAEPGLPSQNESRPHGSETHSNEGLDVTSDIDAGLMPSSSNHNHTGDAGSSREGSCYPRSTEQGQVLVNDSTSSDLQLTILLRMGL